MLTIENHAKGRDLTAAAERQPWLAHSTFAHVSLKAAKNVNPMPQGFLLPGLWSFLHPGDVYEKKSCVDFVSNTVKPKIHVEIN